jgi:cation-transporting ATPase E
MPAVETLARVDALCADKTGTLTEGGITFAGLSVSGAPRAEVEAALAGLANAPGPNATMRAIRDAITSSEQWQPVTEVPFSSARKWSGITFEQHGTWVLGAPEVVAGSDPDNMGAKARALAASGSRVLTIAHGSEPFGGQELPDDLRIVALAELREQVRAEVIGTLAYFADQGVTVRVISGDSPATVQNLAQRVGLSGADLAVDARSLPLDQRAFADAVEANRVFGRVTPDQKRDMVQSLQRGGHTVAMTGDGVNDVLALKEADLGVAMGSGSGISRGVAQVVLLDDDFDVLPSVVAEGRRVLANIETVASLFLTKNVYSLVLSVVVSIIGWPYPFLPRHLTLVSGIAIGIPGFFLALAPNERRFEPGFLKRVLSFSILAGSITSAAIMLTYSGAREEGLSGNASRTAAVIVTGVVSLWVLGIVARPLTGPRLLLLVAMAALFAAAFLMPGVSTFFSLNDRPSPEVIIEAIAFGLGAGLLIDVLDRSVRPRLLNWLNGGSGSPGWRLGRRST